jgi:hypothetical protein
MAIIGIDRHHHGKIPGALGSEAPLRYGTAIRDDIGRPPGAMNRARAKKVGGLDLNGCHGPYLARVNEALRKIARARLPTGAPPFLTKDLEFVEGHPTVVTGVVYGRLPWASNKTEPRYGNQGKLVQIDISLTDLAFLGTPAKKAHPAIHGHAAIAGHPATPATYPDGSPRTLETSLAHEIGHAARLLRHQSLEVWTVEEVLVTNLENQYRYACGIPQRQAYGDIPVKQYPW